jgi:hypothetical protein
MRGCGTVETQGFSLEVRASLEFLGEHTFVLTLTPEQQATELGQVVQEEPLEVRVLVPVGWALLFLRGGGSLIQHRVQSMESLRATERMVRDAM